MDGTDAGLDRLIETLARREMERRRLLDGKTDVGMLLAQLDSAFVEIDALRPHIVAVKRTLII